jgi:hypothetical protein
MIPQGRIRWVAAASFMVALGVGAARYGRDDALAPLLDPPAADAEILVTWCAAGLEPIAGGGCFAPAAPNAKRPAPLLV